MYSYCHIPHRASIFALSSVAIATSIFLATTWNIILLNHSVCLFIFTYASGVVGCLSVVIYYPFASRFSPFLTSAVSLGMGFTGLVASLLGILQQQLNISVGGYFMMIGLVLFGSCICYIGTFWKGFKQLSADPISNTSPNNILRSIVSEPETISVIGNILAQTNDSNRYILSVNYTSWLLIVNQFSICFIYYFLLGLVPYAVSYLEDGDSVLSRMYIGAMIMGSLGRFMCTWKVFRFKSIPLLFCFTFAQFLLGCVVGFQCFFAGKQWIPEDWIWIIVLSYVIFSGLNGYEDTLMYQIAAISQWNVTDVERITRFIGLSNQAGSFTGSIITFTIVACGVLQ
jgi:hypothetical protein